MNSESTISTIRKTNSSDQWTWEIVLQKLPQFLICAELGVLGGTIGVSLAIGVAVVLQLVLSPKIPFFPSTTLLTIAATLMGLGVSWLFSRGAHRFMSGLFHHSKEQGLQIAFVFSVLASLLQTFLFTINL